MFTAESLACDSWFHSHFDDAMTQFFINKQTLKKLTSTCPYICHIPYIFVPTFAVFTTRTSITSDLSHICLKAKYDQIHYFVQWELLENALQNRTNLKTPALRFIVDREHFVNGALSKTYDNVTIIISACDFPALVFRKDKSKMTRTVTVAFSNFASAQFGPTAFDEFSR